MAIAVGQTFLIPGDIFETPANPGGQALICRKISETQVEVARAGDELFPILQEAPPHETVVYALETDAMDAWPLRARFSTIPPKLFGIEENETTFG